MTKHGYKQTPEHIAARIESKIGIPRNDETKSKISKTLTGIKRSDETKRKMSEAARLRGPNRKKKDK